MPTPVPYRKSQGTIAQALTSGLSATPSPPMPATSSPRPMRATPRAPILRASMGVTPPTRNVPSARARNSSPVSSAVYPSTPCRNRGNTNSSPNSPSATTETATFPAAKLRMPNSARSTSTTCPRRRRRCSRNTNPTNEANATANVTATGDGQLDGQPMPTTPNGATWRHQP